MFDYFISLGPACPLASSMSKYGLRSFSGPFDWLYTPSFKWVLHYLETDFKDFLLQENLERYDNYFNHFRDKLSGVRFKHETEDFEDNFSELKNKYNRRISRFLEKIKYRVCYLRSIQTNEEVEYIRNNEGYIKHIIQKYNSDSEIVFLYGETISICDKFAFRSYKLPSIWSTVSHKALRSYFDHADDFLAFCGKNYSGEECIKNLAFDFEREDDAGWGLVERRYITLTALLTHNFSSDEIAGKVIIYGAGLIGQELYKKIKGITSVVCFVDREKVGWVENVKIVSVNEMPYEKDVKVIVSATCDFENIKACLLDRFKGEDIISLDTILNLKF